MPFAATFGHHIISYQIIDHIKLLFFLHIASATKECLSMACLTWRITATRLCIGWAWHRFDFLANSFFQMVTGFKSRVSFICSDFVSLRYGWTMLQNTFFPCNGRMKPTIINNQPSYLCFNVSGDCWCFQHVWTRVDWLIILTIWSLDASTLQVIWMPFVKQARWDSDLDPPFLPSTLPMAALMPFG